MKKKKVLQAIFFACCDCIIEKLLYRVTSINSLFIRSKAVEIAPIVTIRKSKFLVFFVVLSFAIFTTSPQKNSFLHVLKNISFLHVNVIFVKTREMYLPVLR